MNQPRIARLFILASLIALLTGLLFGMTGAIQYLFPEFLKEHLAFNKTRPLHVTLVITWIFNAATGSIYYFLPGVAGRKIYSTKLLLLHFILFVFVTLSIIGCYFLNYFGGREYLEYPPVLAIPVAISWIIFLINYLVTVSNLKRPWPVYLWMWTTGIVFFLFTYFEAYLWMFPFFKDHIVRDTTVQWKSMGGMVGSWNMLIYGIAFYLMEKISGDVKQGSSNVTFFFYFLGLTNLMFNWGHHTYIVPAAPYVKNVSYIISMTELLILGNIIRNWKKSLSTARRNVYNVSYRFLFASEVWIFLNLILAIVISIPAINYYTHGSYITVAHAMGTTIGINTMILFASVFYVVYKYEGAPVESGVEKTSFGFWLTNISLGVFWLSLLAAGLIKAIKKAEGIEVAFSGLLNGIGKIFEVFLGAGIFIFFGMCFLSFPLLFKLFKRGGQGIVSNSSTALDFVIHQKP